MALASPLRIVIVGAGGVGGYFGARLLASGAQVAFIARGAHLDAIRRHGLRVESPKGHLHLTGVQASDDPSGLGPADVVLMAVKMYDLESAAARVLPPLLGPETVVVTLQNGVEAVDIVRRSVGDARVAGGVAYVVAAVAEPGVIRHVSLDELIFGELDGRRSARLERLAEACRAAGFSARVSDAIEVEIWSKFSRLSVFSGVTAVTRSPIGVIRSDPDLMRMLQEACEEAMAVARARGVALPDVLMRDVLQMVHALPYEAKSSMLEDLERGRPLELPWLSGAVVRLGAAAGVPTPIHRFISTVLKPHAHGVARGTPVSAR